MDATPVVIAKIGRPFGIAGWVHLHSYSEPIEQVVQYKELYLQQNNLWTLVKVEAWRRKNAGLVVKLDLSQDRNSAQLLTGSLMGTSAAHLPQLQADQFYWHDLEQLKVIDSEGVLIGEVSHLYNQGASDVMVVESIEHRQLHIPFVMGETIKQVDLLEKMISIDWDIDNNLIKTK